MKIKKIAKRFCMAFLTCILSFSIFAFATTQKVDVAHAESSTIKAEDYFTGTYNVGGMTAQTDNNMAHVGAWQDTLLNGVKVSAADGALINFAFKSKYYVDLDSLTAEDDLIYLQTDAFWYHGMVSLLAVVLYDAEDPTRNVILYFDKKCLGSYRGDGGGVSGEDYTATALTGWITYNAGEGSRRVSWEGAANGTTLIKNSAFGRCDWNYYNAAYPLRIRYNNETNALSLVYNGISYNGLDLSSIFTSGKFGVEISCNVTESNVGIVFAAVGGVDLTGETATVDSNLKITNTVTFKADGEVVAEVKYEPGATSIEEPAVPVKEGYTGKWQAYVLNGDVTVNAVYIRTATATGEVVRVQTMSDLVKSYREDSYLNMDKYKVEYSPDMVDNTKSNAVRIDWTDAVNGENHDLYTVYLSEDSTFENAKIYTTANTYYDLYNLFVHTRYYWFVTADGFESSINVIETDAIAPRLINVDGVTNFRDLGGYCVGENKYIKQGLIYRSAHLDSVSEEGKKMAKEVLGIKTEIDLRSPTEGGSDEGPGRSFFGEGVYYYRCNLGYDFLSSSNISVVQKIFSILSDKNNYPVVIHCTAGADRTGFISFLINALLGAETEDLYDDYQLTSFAKQANSYRPYEVITGYLDAVNLKAGATLSEKTFNYLIGEKKIPSAHLVALKEIMLGNDRVMNTATFKADGEIVAEVKYDQGATSIEEPAVPEKAGFTGRWETYKLNGNIVINAIYTEIPNGTNKIYAQDYFTGTYNVGDMTAQTDNNMARVGAWQDTLLSGVKVSAADGALVNFAFKSRYYVDLDSLTAEDDLIYLQTDAFWAHGMVSVLGVVLYDAEDPTRNVILFFDKNCLGAFRGDGGGASGEDYTATALTGWITYNAGEGSKRISWEGVADGTTFIENSAFGRCDWNYYNAAYPLRIRYNDETNTLSLVYNGVSCSAIDLSSIFTSGKFGVEISANVTASDVGIVFAAVGGVDLTGSIAEVDPDLKITNTATFKADGEVVAKVRYEPGATSIEEPSVPEKEGYIGSWELYELNGNIVVNAVYSPREYNLTINYVYDDGRVAAETYTGTVLFKNSYSIPSPEIEGYRADLESVDGIMLATDKEVTVTYSIEKYSLTIIYVFENGNQAAEDYFMEYDKNSEYSVNSPVIDGYDVDISVVEGTIIDEDKEIVVTYSPKKYVLTIKYVYEDGSQAVYDYVAELAVGEEYSIDSPVLVGYSANISVAEGTMGAENCTIMITYIANEEPPVESTPESESDKESEKVESIESSTSEGSNEKVAGGCGGSVGASSILTLLAVAGIGVVIKRKKD